MATTATPNAYRPPAHKEDREAQRERRKREMQEQQRGGEGQGLLPSMLPSGLPDTFFSSSSSEGATPDGGEASPLLQGAL